MSYKADSIQTSIFATLGLVRNRHRESSSSTEIVRRVLTLPIHSREWNKLQMVYESDLGKEMIKKITDVEDYDPAVDGHSTIALINRSQFTIDTLYNHLTFKNKIRYHLHHDYQIYLLAATVAFAPFAVCLLRRK